MKRRRPRWRSVALCGNLLALLPLAALGQSALRADDEPVAQPPTVAVDTTVAVAPTLAVAATAVDTTYAGDVAAIVRRRCEPCHRPGGGAPMALGSFEQVRSWARAIEREVISGTMPPWHADPCCGRFANDRSLTGAERELLLGWLRGGLSPGNLATAPAPLEAVDATTWRIGEPDAVVELPEALVPATGDLPYHDYVVAAPFDREVWIAAAETQPGNPRVVHHVIVDIVPPVGSPRPDGDPRTVGSLGGYVPGDDPMILPPGLARRLPAGSRLFFQIHYTPTGTPERDRTRLGLVLADAPPEHEARTGIVSTPFLWIPAGSVVSERASWRFRADAMLLSLRPHLHRRGKAFLFRARYPGGREEVLLLVANWDFDWQTTYVLAQPLPIPAGTELLVEATWDNTSANPDNPDPGRDVSWGEATSDEMMIGFFDYYEPAGSIE